MEQQSQTFAQNYVAAPNPFVQTRVFRDMRVGEPSRVEVEQNASRQGGLSVPASVAGVTPGFTAMQNLPGRPLTVSNEFKTAVSPFLYPNEFKDQRMLLRTVMGGQDQGVQAKKDAQTTPQKNVNIDDPSTMTLAEQKKNDPLASPQEIEHPFVNPMSFAKKRKELSATWLAMKAAIDDIAVVEVAMKLGALGNQDGDQNKYKVKGDNVHINGQQWHNKNADEGGYGPVQFVQSFMQMEKRDEAISWLMKEFEAEIGTDAIKASVRNGEVKEKPKYEPPENAPQFLDSIRHYLTKERGIDEKLVERLIVEGRLYADPRENVVMIAKTGQIAELRGVRPYLDYKTGEMKSTKILKPGSDKNSGAFMVTVDKNNPDVQGKKEIAVVEAGIDAMSYHMLYPTRGVASASGASFNYPRRLFFDAWANGYEFHCAFDSDQAGDKASQNIYNSALLFDHFKKEHGVASEKDFRELFTRKVIRLKLRPELDHGEGGGDEDDDVFDDGLDSANVLFFSKENPFEGGAEPVVRYQVKYNQMGFKPGTFEIKVTPELHDHVLKTYKLHRDRSYPAKDWNELVKPKTNNLPKFS
jgi:Toprim-like